MNNYDSCVVNKVVQGSQLTVVWHVDDLKVSHKSQDVVDEFICDMEHEFGKESPLSVSKGKQHNYLGMDLDYKQAGVVVISMESYIDMMLNDAPDTMSGMVTTPAASHLVKINHKPVLLSSSEKEIFVHLAMQGLYLSQCAHPDIWTVISFLSSCLHNPDQDDYKKLKQLIQDLCATHNLTLTLGSNGKGQIKWWVDGSYAIHVDLKGHTGTMMTLGSGSIFSGLWKQKLVTHSSMESEVIGLYDVLPHILWTKKFLDDQGLQLQKTIIYQDNTSSILLEKKDNTLVHVKPNTWMFSTLTLPIM